MKLLDIINVGFDVTYELRSHFFHSSDTAKSGNTMRQYISY
jgi:hypothetical protein